MVEPPTSFPTCNSFRTSTKGIQSAINKQKEILDRKSKMIYFRNEFHCIQLLNSKIKKLDSIHYFNREAVYEKKTLLQVILYQSILDGYWIYCVKINFLLQFLKKNLLFVIIKFYKDISLYKTQPSRQTDKYLFDVSLATNWAISFVRYKVLVQSIKWRVWNKIQL